jgi:hypothetical protein
MHPSSFKEIALVILAWVWIFLPLTPVITAWALILRLRQSGTPVRKSVIPLSMATVSYGWILVALIFPAIIAAPYSTLRYRIIWMNLGVMAFLAVWMIILEKNIKWRLVAACALTSSVWFYLALVNHIVSTLRFW